MFIRFIPNFDDIRWIGIAHIAVVQLGFEIIPRLVMVLKFISGTTNGTSLFNLKAEELSILFPGSDIEKDSISAVKKALSETPENEIVCVCGSLYLAGEIRGEFA